MDYTIVLLQSHSMQLVMTISPLVLNLALNGSGQDFMNNCQGKKILDLAPTRPTNCDLLISLLLCISWALKLYLSRSNLF
jgi:hypothetical protein